RHITNPGRVALWPSRTRGAAPPDGVMSYQSCVRIESDAGVCMVIRRGIVVGALTTLFGTFLSGALGLSVVAKTHPQPPWHDAQTFVSSFHPVQIIAYLAGFLLVGGLFRSSISSCNASNSSVWLDARRTTNVLARRFARILAR